MPFYLDSQDQTFQLGGNTFNVLAIVGETVKIRGGAVSFYCPPARRERTCDATVQLGPDQAAGLAQNELRFTAPGFMTVKLTRGEESAYVDFCAMPKEALTSPASRQCESEGRMRQVLQNVVGRNVNRESLARALAERSDAMCGALIGRPLNEGISLAAFGADPLAAIHAGRGR